MNISDYSVKGKFDEPDYALHIAYGFDWGLDKKIGTAKNTIKDIANEIKEGVINIKN